MTETEKEIYEYILNIKSVLPAKHIEQTLDSVLHYYYDQMPGGFAQKYTLTRTSKDMLDIYCSFKKLI